MDFLNKAFAQIRDLFLSMTPAARITTALLLAVVVISLGYLFTHEIAGPDVYLLSGEMFSDRDIDNMRIAFAQEGLNGYEIEGNKVRVPRGRRTEYLTALAKHNALPEDFDEILTKALSSSSPFAPPSQREALQKADRERFLSRTLSTWPEIERAYVTYETRKRGGLSRDVLCTASVQVKPRGTDPLDPAVISSIRTTVVKSVPGLKPEDCAVIDINAGRATLGGPDNPGNPMDDAYIAEQHYYEEKYKKDVLNALGIPGATVTAFAVLSNEKLHQEQEVKYDPKGSAPLQTSETTSEKSSESGAPAGRPGYLAQNTARSLATATAKGTSETETQSESNQQNLVSTTKTLTETRGHMLERVAVTVTVPTSYYEQVWRRDNPPKEGEEAKEIQQSDLEPIRTRTEAQIKGLVATIIPPPKDGSDPKSLITVAEFPDLPSPPMPEPGLAQNVFAWLGDSWSTLGLIGLALFSLVMLRSMVRSAPASEPGRKLLAAPSIEGGEEEESAADRAAHERKLKRFSGSGASLRDELSDLVSEDPDTAANILRNWIGTGA
jgi:flagellar M-ring protein FliF